MKKEFLLVLFCIGVLVLITMTHKVLRHITPQDITIIDTPLDIQTEYSVVSGSYPIIEGISEDFSQAIHTQIERASMDHAEHSKDNWIARAETDPAIPQVPNPDERFTLNVSYNILRNDDEYISLVLTISGYEGGAHGYETLTTYVYDLTNEEIITTESFFRKFPGALEKLSTESRRILTKQLQSAYNEYPLSDTAVAMLESGTTPLWSNFALFVPLSDTDGRIYFTQYQVGPYTVGIQSIDIEIPHEMFIPQWLK